MLRARTAQRQDEPRASPDLLRDGLEAGDASCCVNAGVAYDKGTGTAKGSGKKLRLRQEGVRRRRRAGLSAERRHRLRSRPRHGEGFAAAYRAADLACTKKIVDGCGGRQALVNAKGIPRDVISQGLDRLDRACSSTESYAACTSLGVYYIEGRAGIPKRTCRAASCSKPRARRTRPRRASIRPLRNAEDDQEIGRRDRR